MMFSRHEQLLFKIWEYFQKFPVGILFLLKFSVIPSGSHMSSLYCVWIIRESLILPIYAKKSNQLICCLRAILQFQHRLDALSVPTVVAKINRVSMEEHVEKTVRRPENDSSATVRDLLARSVSRVKQFWSIMQLQSHILWAVFFMLKINRVLNQSKGSFPFCNLPDRRAEDW